MLLFAVYVTGGIWLLLCLMLYFLQENYIYYPSRQLVATPEIVGLEYEDVSLSSSNGNRISGWYVPAENERGVVLFLHGNAGNISHRLHTLENFHRMELSSLIIDYQGYGESEGRPGEQATYDDAMAAWDHLVTDRGYAPEEIIIFGRSLGGAVAAWLATRTNAAGVILESVFTSINDVAQRIYWYIPVTLLTRIHYPVKDFVPAIDSPILIIHSTDDELIPYEHGESLHALTGSRGELLTISGDHNHGFMHSEDQYLAGLQKFIARVLH